jgi:hypothetical protein
MDLPVASAKLQAIEHNQRQETGVWPKVVVAGKYGELIEVTGITYVGYHNVVVITLAEDVRTNNALPGIAQAAEQQQSATAKGA